MLIQNVIGNGIDMIKARELFLLPCVSMLFLVIPFIGIVITLLILILWYSRNQKDIHDYFRGNNYNKIEDVAKEYDEALV